MGVASPTALARLDIEDVRKVTTATGVCVRSGTESAESNSKSSSISNNIISNNTKSFPRLVKPIVRTIPNKHNSIAMQGTVQCLMDNIMANS